MRDQERKHHHKSAGKPEGGGRVPGLHQRRPSARIGKIKRLYRRLRPLVPNRVVFCAYLRWLRRRVVSTYHQVRLHAPLHLAASVSIKIRLGLGSHDVAFALPHCDTGRVPFTWCPARYRLVPFRWSSLDAV